MTIAIAWIRKVQNTEELVVCTDSRLGGWGRWDCAPKLLALPRNDGVIAFAGHTQYAYPMMIQALAACTQHPKVLSRALDLEDLKGHIVRVLNHMLDYMEDLPPECEIPDVRFLLAGWSWRRSEFIAWMIHFDESINRFTFSRGRRWAGENNEKYHVFIGDRFEEYKSLLISKLREKGKLASGGFDMEPFEVIREMLRANKYGEIGGPPQLLKIYRHMNVLPLGVFWPNRDAGQISILGRPLLGYESSHYLIIDPDTLRTVKHSELGLLNRGADVRQN